jgi:hypothetical protein
MTTSPVQHGNAAVVLSARTDVPSNYPVPATQSAFNTAPKAT